MNRREMMRAGLAASAVALTGEAHAVGAGLAPASRQYYVLRKYFLRQGPQVALTEKYVATALIPALNRLGIAPVGAFNLSIGPETPVLYLLMPSASLETLVNADLHLR